VGWIEEDAWNLKIVDLAEGSEPQFAVVERADHAQKVW
jgi:hypothetical protein